MPSPRAYFAIPFLIFLGLGLATLWTASPASDDGWFGIPGCFLVQEGRLANPVIVQVLADQTGIDKRQYWQPPLHLLQLAAAFRLGGCGIPAGRSVSLFWGLVTIGAVFYLLFSVTGDSGLAAFAASLLALDPALLDSAASLRPDITCFGAGLAALALYRWLRVRSLPRAMFVSNALVACAGLIHPNGLMAFLALMLMTWQLDRDRLRVSQILYVAPPYLLAALGWGLYIAQDPELFRIQWSASVAHSYLLNPYHTKLLGKPILTLMADWKGKYGAYYFSGGGSAAATAIRALPFVILVLGAVLSAGRREIRPLLWIAIVYALFATFLSGSKMTYYLVYTVAFLEILSAVTWWKWITSGGKMRLAGIALVSLLALCQLARTANRVRTDAYHQRFLPAADYVLRESSPQDLLYASREFYFPFSGKREVLDDLNLGLVTGKPARWIILGEPDSAAGGEWEAFAKISAGYREVLRNPRYAVYVRR